MAKKLKIVQLVSHENTLVGLGDDGKTYQWNPQLKVWVPREV